MSYMANKKAKAEFRLTFITVSGRGRYPLDMMRYDCATPASEEDSDKIGNLESRSAPVKIRLKRFSSNGGKATAGRWESFGWTVVEDSGVD